MRTRSTAQLSVRSYSLFAAALVLFAFTANAQQVSLNGNGFGKGGKPKPTPTPAPAPVLIPGDPAWTGSASTDWSNSANWSPASTPAPTDIASFSGTFTNQPTLTSSASVGGLWMTGTLGQNVTISASSGSLTINGTTLINGTDNLGILVDNSGSQTLTISAPIILGANQIWRNSSLNVLTISGTVNNNGNTLTLDGTGDKTISGAISGSGGLISNLGTVKLSGNNSYSGGTTANDGLLWLQSSTALGSASGSLTVNAGTSNGAIVDLGGNSISIGNLTGSGGNIWNNLNGGNTTVTLTIGTGNTGGGNYQGVISNNNGASNGIVALTKVGTGTITLSGANLYSGGTIVDGGTLLINTAGSSNSGTGSGAITVNSGGTLGGTGFINAGSNSVTINGTLMGGSGTSTSDKLTVTGAVSLQSGSVIQLALGATSTAHSTLAIGSGGSISFQTLQQFTFIDLGAAAGTTYNGIITGTGVTPVVTAGWTNTNGWTGAFTWDAANGGEINFNLIAVPEPGTWCAAGLATFVIGYQFVVIRRRRRDPHLAHSS